MEFLNLANPVYGKMVNQARASRDEAEVASLWVEVLHAIGIDAAHGYQIIPEKKIHGLERPDLVVRVVLSEVVVLIVECKCFEHDTLIGWDNAQTQLGEYLKKSECQNGILAIGHKCKFYNLRDVFISERPTYDWTNAFDRIIAILIHFTRTESFE